MMNRTQTGRIFGWTAAGVFSVFGMTALGAVAASGAMACGSNHGGHTAADGCCSSAPAAQAVPAQAVPAQAVLPADQVAPVRADAAAQPHVDAAVKSYLAVQQLLAADKADGVAAELKKLHDAAAAMANHAGDEKVKAEATAVFKASDGAPKDLTAARAAFKPLSAAMIRLTQLAAPTAEAAPALYEATCPMAKAEWLQASKEVVNPYMGKEMLDCGMVKRKVEPAPAKDAK